MTLRNGMRNEVETSGRVKCKDSWETRSKSIDIQSIKLSKKIEASWQIKFMKEI
jgi:hypothetical protein